MPMAHFLAPSSASLAPVSARSEKHASWQIPGFEGQWSSHRGSDQARDNKSAVRLIDRRALVSGLTGGIVGSLVVGKSACAAARRPPTPPPMEKKDLNVSGVQAKILASKRRKEAMEQTMEKLRAKGKPISPPAQ
ncbi:uncharacterized protein LOC131246064 [Magnolia sinica]|uniref:uncharacterized protein LOC131246064 n=1 Tax=Magnolia sinica TaxID=86752 RepID=UPI00265A4C66|nr:uncharacterized protein LOC131246064 [Magnolia sinica]